MLGVLRVLRWVLLDCAGLAGMGLELRWCDLLLRALDAPSCLDAPHYDFIVVLARPLFVIFPTLSTTNTCTVNI